jgi:hypothetical protein
MARLRALAVALAFVAGFFAIPALAHAAPAQGSGKPTGGSASFSTGKGGSASGQGSGYDWPDLVVGGNSISFHGPLQIGIVGYLPKARFSFQYDRQIRKAHWIFAGVSLVADRGDFNNFRMDDCGLGATTVGVCGKGGVIGFDVYAGYAYKFYLKKRPWLVPIVRGALGFSWFALPDLGGGDANREQSRTKSWTLHVKPGGGIRIFPWQQLGFGADLNLPIGFLVHTDLPLTEPEDKQGAFLLGIEILPLVVEYRF